MPEPTDKNSAEQIRAEYVEIIAQAFYEADSADEMATTGEPSLPWERLDEAGRWRCVHDAALAVDALATVGRLPTGIDSRYIGRGLLRRSRYVTEWQDPEASE